MDSETSTKVNHLGYYEKEGVDAEGKPKMHVLQALHPAVADALVNKEWTYIGEELPTSKTEAKANVTKS